jgi:ATP-dependent exoDNAse (exonuclease V) beta subunit
LTFSRVHHEFPKLERSTVDGVRVYKTPSGRAYPSVTTVTGLLKSKFIQEWRQRVGEEEANKISSKASRRGTRIHSLCEDYLSNKPTTPDYHDHEMWKSIQPHLDRINNIHALEDRLYSDHLEVAGTVDCIGEFDGKLSVIDFKTSSKIKSKDDIHDYFMQCSAYAVSFEELTKIPVSQLVIVMAVENENPLVFLEKRDSWIHKFKVLRKEYKNLKKV